MPFEILDNGFNSTLVQLKTSESAFDSDFVKSFQFHFGSIKNNEIAAQQQQQQGFNSTLVQLKT